MIISSKKYNEKGDAYSFGFIVYFILNEGKLPDVVNGEAIVPDNSEMLTKQLLEACWENEPCKRPRFSIILEILEQNNFNLVSLSDQEKEELLRYFAGYKALMPSH